MQLPSFWYSILQTPSASSSQNQLCFLNFLGSTYLASLSHIMAGKLFRAVGWVIVTIGLISFFSSSSFTAFHWLVSSVLKTVTSHIVCHWLLVVGRRWKTVVFLSHIHGPVPNRTFIVFNFFSSPMCSGALCWPELNQGMQNCNGYYKEFIIGIRFYSSGSQSVVTIPTASSSSITGEFVKM